MDVNKKLDRTEECRRWLGKRQKCLRGSSLGPAQALFSGFEYTPPLSHLLFGQIAHPDQIVAGKSLRHHPSQQSIPVLATLPHLTSDHSCSCPHTNATALCNPSPPSAATYCRWYKAVRAARRVATSRARSRAVAPGHGGRPM